MLHFEEIEIEGFGSFQIPFMFRLDHEGLTVIKAKNGTGKTTILSALSWVCTGYPLKEGATIETWERLRTKLWRGTKVRVSFKKDKDSYEVIRCKEFTGKVNGAKGKNRLILIKNGQEIKEAKSKGSAKELLTEILGFSYSLFKSALAMGQKVKGLVEEDNSSRVKIFEEAFNVAYINHAKDLGKKKLKTERETYTGLASDLAVANAKIETQQNVYDNCLVQQKNFDKVKEHKIKKYRKSIKELKGKIEGCKGDSDKDKELTKAIKVIEAKLNLIGVSRKEKHKLEIDRTKMEGAVKFEERTHHNIECERITVERKISNLPQECESCGKPYSKAELLAKKKVLKSTLTALEHSESMAENAMNQSKSKVKAITKQIASKVEVIAQENEYINTKQKLENKRDKYKPKEGLREEYVGQLKEAKRDLKEAKKEKYAWDLEKMSKDLRSWKDKIKPTKRLARKCNKRMEALQWCIDDPLSNSGIKAFIFDQMMGDFNSLLLEYADILGFQVRFEVNMDSARKSIDAYILKDKMEIPQKDLSGGQGQLVNIAAAFALHDVVNKVLNTNILFIDEAFESLDADNIELVSEIIQRKAETKSVTLITHQKSFAPTNARMMALRLHQGVTQYDRP